MLLKTSTLTAPWTVVEGNCKWYARVKVLKTLVDGLSQELAFDPFAELPETKKGRKKRAQRGKRRGRGKRTQAVRSSPSGTPMPMIDRFEYGTVVIDGAIHHSDVITLPDGRVKTLWLAEGSALRAKDASRIIKAKPEVTILGRGTAGNLRLGPEAESRRQHAGLSFSPIGPTKPLRPTESFGINERRLPSCTLLHSGWQNYHLSVTYP